MLHLLVAVLIAAQEKPVVAVAPFKDATGTDLGKTAQEALHSKLEAVRRADAAAVQKAMEALKLESIVNAEDAAKLAKALDAAFVVFGTVTEYTRTERGATCAVELSVVGADGKAVLTKTAKGLSFKKRGADDDALACAFGMVLDDVMAAIKPRRAPVPKEKRINIAVLDFADKTTVKWNLAATAAGHAAELLTASEQFTLVDRAKVDAADPAKAGVRFVVFGAVSDVGVRAEVKDGVKLRTAQVSVQLRVIDVDSGETVYSETVEATASGEGGAKPDALAADAVKAAVAKKLDALIDAVLSPKK